MPKSLQSLLAENSPVADLLSQPPTFAQALANERQRVQGADQASLLTKIEEHDDRKLYHELMLCFSEYCRLPVTNPLAYAALFLGTLTPRFRYLNDREYARAACAVATLLREFRFPSPLSAAGCCSIY